MPRPFALAAPALLAAVLAVAGPAAAQTTEALQIAVMRDDPAAIEAAIRAGSDPRAMIDQGSLLAAAALMGKPRAVRVLLAHGADPAAPGPNGGNAVNAAFFAINGTAILGRGDVPDPAQRAAGVEVVRLLAARKVGLDNPVRLGPSNVTPLIQAAEAGAFDLVQILLDGGANPNATNAGGYTALDYAVDRAPIWTTLPQDHRADIVRALLAKGARRDRAGADRVTPLARARRAGNPEIIALLEGK
ncbi:ankyrin repeat domain-containing protein [Phenylobacterium sp.]|uniref:ankyrin repeat domain-containing protein n=1 Tax=Phenylobacterium sp. TaxID=1871053 RepID=UPI0025E2C7A3|nr:ankyrin repeat domain-containing protein [Phenylobacterium sp.]